jgi:hypothetical protein
MFFWIELGLTAVALAVGCAVPDLGRRWFEPTERLLGRLAQRRGLSVVIVGLAALALRAALLPILPIPIPGGHDDYGYLLLADTFAHGRLTNPTHPMWVHFESFHIIWQPTYTAKFYPAQSLIMALSQVVTGHPFWGVWLSVGLMCGAICWMLQGYLPPGWALLGGFLAVIRFGSFNYWANAYAGSGPVAAMGGALVLGSLPRIKRSPRTWQALLMGMGFAMVANSRPYEGLFFGLAVAGALALWMFGKDKPSLRISVVRVVAPLILVLLLTSIAMGYYFWRTTGSPWDTPYLVNERTYNPAPSFPWQSPKPLPVYHHEIFRTFYVAAPLARYQGARTLGGLLGVIVNIPMTSWLFYLGPVLTLPVLLALATLPYGFSFKNVSSDTRLLLASCGAVFVVSAVPIKGTAFLVHYAAPLAGAILALVLLAMRRVRSQMWRGKPASFITAAVPLICFLLLALRVAAEPLHLPVPRPWPGGGIPIWCTPLNENPARARMLARLKAYDGKQLVIVRYGLQHEITYHEWVFNEADIDAAKVIWARDMGAAKNVELINYFKDRHVWLLEPDENPPKLAPYDCEDSPAKTEGVSAGTGPECGAKSEPGVNPLGGES